MREPPIPCTLGVIALGGFAGWLWMVFSVSAQTLLVFATNAIAFTNAIWQAHQELFARP